MIRKVTTQSARHPARQLSWQIRTIIDEETEQIWTGKKAPKQALEDSDQARQRAAGAFQKTSSF